MTIEQRKKIINELNEQRKEIKKQLHELTQAIHKHQIAIKNKEYYTKKPPRTDTLVYRTFGKSYKELTISEKRKYDALRQKECRERKRI